MKSFKVHLIRCQITQHSLDGVYEGQLDTGLCEEGIKQLKSMLADGGYPDCNIVFISPLLRCRQTAELIFPNVEAAAVAELNECCFGEFEGHTAEELSDNESFLAWVRGDKAAVPPKGESGEEFSSRICTAFARIIEAMMESGVAEAAMVLPGGVIMALMSAFALPELPIHDWLLPAGCGFTVRTDSLLWRSGRKLEMQAELPLRQMTLEEERMGWDWYPEVD